MRWLAIVALGLVCAASPARSQDSTATADVVAGLPLESPLHEESEGTDAPAAETVAALRALVLDEGELEQGAELVARLRDGGPWSREDLAAILELEAYAQFGLENEGAWTRALQELATLDPGHRLPSFYPLALTRVLAGFAATARSLNVSLEHATNGDRVVVTGALLHDEAGLLRRLTLRERTLGDASGWREHDLASGRVVLPGPPGAEIELEAIAIGPNDVELARSGVDLIAIPVPTELWEDWPFWVVVGVVASAAIAVAGVTIWAASLPPQLTFTSSWELRI